MIVCAVFWHCSYTLTGEVKILLTLDRKEERPQSETITAVKDDIFEFEQHRGVRYVLDQLHSFFATCELMKLPCDNPFSFFTTLNYLLHHPDKFTIDGRPDDLESYRLIIEDILMLYASYGNTIFEFASVADDTVFNYLWEQPSLPWIGEELDRFDLKERVCELVEWAERREIYKLYPELIQYNEQAHNLKQIELAERLTPRIVYKPSDIVAPDDFVLDLYHLFLLFYAKTHSTACEIQVGATLPNREQNLKQYVEGLLRLREIEKKFLALLKSDVEVSEPTEKITPLDVGKMSEYVVQLVKLEADYPELFHKTDNSNVKPCVALGKFYKQWNDDGSNIDPRLNSNRSQDAALSNLRYATSQYSPSQSRKLQGRLKELLHSYADNVVYRFFDSAYKEMIRGTIPQLAPIYLWHLFVAYADPLYQQKTYLFEDSAKKADFSGDAVLKLNISCWQSEERKSDCLTAYKCTLYDELICYFDKKPIKLKYPTQAEVSKWLNIVNWDEFVSTHSTVVTNKVFCQYLLQKCLRTNFHLYTDTGITGVTLETRVPLYRLFRPLYDALHSMDGELWKQMPSNKPLTVTLERADEFYNMRRSDNAALTFLRESQGRLPVSRRKNLPLGICVNIVREALIRQNGNPIGCIDSYIVQHKELSDFAGKSAENQDLLRLTIYRMSLERAAHTLSRDLMESSMQLFDQWVMREALERMWKHFFEEHKEMFRIKRITDKIKVGSLKIYGRVLCRVDLLQGKLPTPSEIAQKSYLAVMAGKALDQCGEYISEVCSHFIEAVYQMQPSSTDWAAEYTKTALQAMQSGFSGVALPEYTVYTGIADNARDAEAIHAALGERYVMQYKNPIRHMFEKCGEDFAVLACVRCKDLEADTLDALSSVSFWLAQDCVHAVIIRYDDKLTHTAEQHIASLASRLAVPLFLQSENQTYDKQCALLQNTAIFGFESGLS